MADLVALSRRVIRYFFFSFFFFFKFNSSYDEGGRKNIIERDYRIIYRVRLGEF